MRGGGHGGGEGPKEAAMIRKRIGVTELCNSVGMKHRVLGDIDRCVTTPAVIHEGSEQSVSFCSRKAEGALELIRNSRARVIVCSSDLGFAEEDYRDRTLILVSNPRLAFIRIMQRYFAERVRFGIHPTAVIDEEADIHPNVSIGPSSYIGRCRIGENTTIYGNVYIYPNVRIGKNVIIHAGTVVGAAGFGYERNDKGELENFPHVGGVVIEDNVEIGSNASIDRGTLGNTIVGQGSKIDNLCHIAHNVVIGKHCAIIAQSMIGGSTRIGDYCWIAPCACLRDGIEIGRNAVIGMGSVVTRNVGDGQVVFGAPAKEHKKLR
jgi:UDP-3-O-[3-hydroxymyristoyl] glucosamine N-acyltransferase